MASESDDLSDFVDDEFNPTAKKRANKKEYKITNALKAPRSITFSARALHGETFTFLILFFWL